MKNSNCCSVCNFEFSPQTKVYESEYWRVDLSDNQAYLGRSIVSLNRHAENLSELSSQEWQELKAIINRFEKALTSIFNTTSFNWTALMNDAYKSPSPQPDVHFHVWPRYRDAPKVNNELFSDPNFAHHYDKTAERSVSDETMAAIHDKITQTMDL